MARTAKLATLLVGQAAANSAELMLLPTGVPQDYGTVWEILHMEVGLPGLFSGEAAQPTLEVDASVRLPGPSGLQVGGRAVLGQVSAMWVQGSYFQAGSIGMAVPDGLQVAAAFLQCTFATFGFVNPHGADFRVWYRLVDVTPEELAVIKRLG